jgi:RNA polymerase sigma factor (TIGR02999 family)
MPLQSKIAAAVRCSPRSQFPDWKLDLVGFPIYMGGPMSEVTLLLNAIAAGEPKASSELLPLVYEELRKLAASKMAHEKPGQTLQATALVHEAWIRMVGSNDQKAWDNRGHFFSAAAEAMRRILVDRARQKARIRHGGALERVDLEHVTLATEDTDSNLLAIHEALEKLAAEAPEKAEIVKLRYFTGLEHAEIAQALGISLATVQRHWTYARAWLYREIQRNLGNT